MELKQRKRIVNRYEDGKANQLSDSVKAIGAPNWGYKLPSMDYINGQASMVHVDSVGNKLKPQPTNSDYAGVIGSGMQGAMSIYNNYNMQRQSVKDVGDLMTNAGTSNNSVMGIGYTQQNDIDGAQAMKEVNSAGLSGTLGSTASGAMAGAQIAGPWGAVAGGAIGLVSGLFGWGSSKRKQRQRIWNAQQLASRTNQMNRSVAATEGLQQQYYQNNGNTTYGLLYANRGKDLKRPKYEY